VLDSNTATVTVSIKLVNVAPVANNGTLSTSEDTAATGLLTGSDGDADPLVYSLVGNAAKGTVTITNISTGAYTYTPNANTTGSDSFTFKVNDGLLDSNVATVSVNITAVNDAPVAVDSAQGVTEDVVASGVLVGSDIDSTSLTYSLVNNGAKGTVVITNASTGAFSYTPNANANGSDSFSFKVNDGLLDSNVATVSVSITAVNDAPVAVAATLNTDENIAVNSVLVASDIDGDVLTYSIVNNGSKGTALITNPGTGAYTYTPNANATGSDSFSFKVNDGTSDSNITTVFVNIAVVNVAPWAYDSSINIFENIAVNATFNVIDADGDALSSSIVSNGSKGTAVVIDASTGTYRYTPNPGAVGVDSFTFKANDGLVDSRIATVSVTIVLVNFPPEVADDIINTDEDVAVAGVLQALDPDGDPLSYSIVSNGSKGTAVITDISTGAYTYSPNADANGVDSFSFKVNDGLLGSVTATVTVNIAPVNDVPVVSNLSFSLLNNNSISTSLKAFDKDGDKLIYTLHNNVAMGTVTIDANNGVYTYVPRPGATGIDSFSYSVSDGQANSSVATITIELLGTSEAGSGNSAASGGAFNLWFLLVVTLLSSLRFVLLIPAGKSGSRR
jgi:hypothetical protein